MANRGDGVHAPGKGSEDAADPIDRLSAKPDFQALIYSGPLGIRGVEVTKELSPTFILVGDNDGASTVLVNHYLALKKAAFRPNCTCTPRHRMALAFATASPPSPWTPGSRRFQEFLSVPGNAQEGMNGTRSGEIDGIDCPASPAVWGVIKQALGNGANRFCRKEVL